MPVTFCHSDRSESQIPAYSRTGHAVILPLMQASSIPEASSELAVSVVLFHSPLEHLEALVDSLIASLANAQMAGVELVCVDHSESSEYAARCHELLANYDQCEQLRVRFLAAEKNGGYGAGHNRAMAESNSRFHLILNPDVEITAEAMSRALRVLRSHDELAMLAPTGFSSTGEPEYLSKAYPSVWVLGLRAFAPGFMKSWCQGALSRYEMHDNHDPGPLREITLASGCCMWVRREVFDDVGGFDEGFFLYFEDYDLSLKMIRRGSVMEHREIIVVHHGGDASKKGWRHVRWFIKGATRFFNRWGWKWFG